MNSGTGKSIILITLSFIALTTGAFAGTQLLTKQVLTKVDAPAPLFTEDRIEFQGMTGALFSPCGVGPSTPHYNYEKTTLRLGWMLNSPDADGCWLDGNFEALIELSTNAAFSGFGNVHVGPTALVRYNFVQQGWKVIPYIQGGAGIVYSDGYENKNQRALGQGFEFTPQAAIGIRYLINDKWSANLEGNFEHISNASTASRNLGTNAIGGQVGVSYFFDKLWK